LGVQAFRRSGIELELELELGIDRIEFEFEFEFDRLIQPAPRVGRA
jgi:hypothetical protein